MKRSRFALSVLLIPALVMAGGTGGCTGGGGGSTPPVLSLPATVSGVQAETTGPTSFSLTLSGVAAGFALTNTAYGVWCTNPKGYVPSTVNDLSTGTLFDPSGSANYTVYNSYNYASYAPGNDTGMGGQVFGGTQVLTLSQEWNAINYILNHLTGTNGNIPATVNDIQAAIWQLLHPADSPAHLTDPAVTLDANAVLLYQDAVANGTAFVAGNGQYAAAILVPDPQSVTGSPLPYQGMLVPVIVTSGGCTGTSSATITKTASVYTANAFQAVTYTYVVKNTGTTTLTNVVVTDDNGTPGYAEDDFTVGTVATLAPGTSVTFKATVYLPIRLFAQIGGNAIWDTLIPQIPSTPANSLLLTYLIDNDVTDNTYGTGASAGWKAVGGHKLSDLIGNYAEFKFRDGKGNIVSDFRADYLSASSKFPSGYGSAGLHGNMIYGSSKYVDYITSTLSENLNGYSKFYGDTVNSPVGDSNWQSTAGYKVLVDNGIFGFFGMGSATVETNYVGATTFGNVVTNPFFWWYCQKNFSYNPQVVTSRIVSTAYLCASVLNCCTVVHAQASVCVTLNGCPPPTCSQSYVHKCQHQDECRCPCANCQSGNHSKCTQHNCSDPRCGDQGCVQQCQCHCAKCSSGDHSHCAKVGCHDVICHIHGCKR